MYGYYYDGVYPLKYDTYWYSTAAAARPPRAAAVRRAAPVVTSARTPGPAALAREARGVCRREADRGLLQLDRQNMASVRRIAARERLRHLANVLAAPPVEPATSSIRRVAGSSGPSAGAGPPPAARPRRPRARELGIWPGHLPTGHHNAITDVPGVLVGQVTLASEDGTVNTGGTAVLPHSGSLFDEKVPAAAVVGNGFGKLAGTTQVDELGEIEAPVLLTNTLAVGNGMQAVIDYTLDQPGNEAVRSVNAVVGETNDGGLNDIRAHYNLTPQLLRQAIDGATGGPVSEGAVGAGAGTMCYSMKGGIGTSSRCVHMGSETSYVLRRHVHFDKGC